jgi:hypothetical protein
MICGQVAPLYIQPSTDHSALKKKTPIPWTDEMQKAFNKMCAFMVAPSLAAYPDHNKQFDFYTDVSDFQLGACIVQDGRPVTYYSCKLSKLPQSYTILEKEMLSIVDTLCDF